MEHKTQRQLPPLAVDRWLNCEQPPEFSATTGKVRLIEVFQMLCPACVSHSLPQAKRAFALFRNAPFEVIGLHSVFEHHEAQGRPEVLAAFLHENQIRFPVAIDKHDNGSLPVTFQQLGLSGTPTTILVDQEGQIRSQHFGIVEDMALGAEITAILGAG